MSRRWHENSKGIIFRIHPTWLTRFGSQYRPELVKRCERWDRDEERDNTLGGEGPCEACSCLPGRDEELRSALAIVASLAC